jgi:tetratricopeptide (TPR) repeat protein
MKANPGSALRPAGPGDLSSEAEWLMIAASVYREPVPCDALLARTGTSRAGRSDRMDQAGLSDLIGECAAAGLLILDTTRQPLTVRVSTEVAVDLHAQLTVVGRSAAIARAHRRAAHYWQRRVTALRQNGQSGVHDLLEARHHLIEADDRESTEAITEEICSRLHAFGAYPQEEALIGDILQRVPRYSARWTAWAYRLGKACQLQADYATAGHWFGQALDGFERLADTGGMASCLGYLGALAQVRGDYAEAERCYVQSQILERAPAAPAAGRAREGQPKDGRLAGRSAAGRAGAEHRLAGSAMDRARRRRSLAVVSAISAVLMFATAIAAVHPAHRGTAQADPALAAAATARSAAGSWIGRWVALDAIVACDPLMCSALQADGLPAARILEITASSPDPLGSDIVAASAAIRGQFGSRLATVYAPTVLASFGAGSARIDVRMVAADGTSAYTRALRADLVARQSAGAALLANPAISASATAASQLAAGRVDSRLLMTLAGLAAIGPVAIAAFGGAGPGSSAGVPLLSVDIAAGATRSGGGPSAATRPDQAATRRSLAGLATFLHAQEPPLLAASVRELRLPGGGTIVRIAFTAPAPLGLLSGGA